MTDSLAEAAAKEPPEQVGGVREAPPPVQPSAERARADLREARRLYDVAALIHEHGAVGSVDSVFVLHKALRLTASLLVRLGGSEPSEDLALLSIPAQQLNVRESLVAHDVGEDLSLVAAVHRRASELGASVERADVRRYDRAFVRTGRLLGALEAHLSVVFPAEERTPDGRWRTAVAVVAALGLGFFLGSRAPRGAALSREPPVNLTTAPTATGIVATFFRDEKLTDAAVSRRDSAIDFDWGSGPPPGLAQNDHFSVRWVGRLDVPADGSYDFHLSSDDGGRLFIDDQLVIDNWSVHTLQMRDATVKLSAGLHPIRVEYFDGTGDAAVKLEWNSPAFERRTVSGADLR